MGVQQLLLKRLGITLRLCGVRICLTPPYTLAPGQPTRGSAYPPRHPIAGLMPAGSVGPEGLSLAGRVRPWRALVDGISTVCPSTTPFGLTLGPTKPGRTNLPQETLNFRPERFSLLFRYSYRHSHSTASTTPYAAASRQLEAPLPIPPPGPTPRGEQADYCRNPAASVQA